MSRPPWLKARLGEIGTVSKVLEDLGLNTVCEGAGCPNRGDCFSKGRATFLIMGSGCTRHCAFCALGRRFLEPVDKDEPWRVAEAARRLSLSHVVITSVTRDDLPDGGAFLFSRTADLLKNNFACRVEILVPDFQKESLKIVCRESVDLLAHNLETVRRLTPSVRDRASYDGSLAVLAKAKSYGKETKSGLMLGLGERKEEILQALEDLIKVGCRDVTLGQYLSPGKFFFPVARFVEPEEFEDWRSVARKLGFERVESGPLIRSSYASG
ncbi:MAG TPA: lipoyl synthase [Cyanobacteria bacterium UBA8530]|nr:lipoyl synthase [Cyanobacteria bacterium UBA8530]